MASQPRINSALVIAIRMAKMSKSTASGGQPKVYHFVQNQNRPDKAYTTERAKKAGKANACSGKIFVTVPLIILDQWGVGWGDVGRSDGMQTMGCSSSSCCRNFWAGSLWGTICGIVWWVWRWWGPRWMVPLHRKVCIFDFVFLHYLQFCLSGDIFHHMLIICTTFTLEWIVDVLSCLKDVGFSLSDTDAC